MKTKTKITVAVVSVLSVVALAGTGYAGWVISQDASKNQTGNVVVYNVKDNGVDLSDLTFTEGKNSIIWGTTTKTAEKNWFGTEDEHKETEGGVTTVKRENEFFTPAIEFTISNKDTTDTVQPNVTAKLTVASNENYSKCKSAGLIQGPEAGENNAIEITGTEQGLKKDIANGVKSNEFKVTLSVGKEVFGWGDHFKVDNKNVNPINFYNQYEPTAESTFAKSDEAETKKTYFEDAKDSMTAIYGLEGVTFKIEVSVTHGTSGK